MSKSLYWSPPPSEVKERSVDYLRHEIARYVDPDWNGDSWSDTVGGDLIPFLKGIIAAGSKEQKEDAQELIDAIHRYGKVVLTIH